MLTLILFFVGFFILVKGSGILIDGASSVARRLEISSWAIGITIVGIGTSIPEFGITLASALNNAPEIGLGTILGSNTFNILFILGLSALIFPVGVKRERIWQDLSVNIWAVLVVIAFAVLPILGDKSFLGITRPEAAILFTLFLVWLFYIALRKKPNHAELESPQEPSLKIFTVPISVLMILAGILSVYLGARWVVHGAEVLARAFGASEALVGLTVIGLGTSLPELSVSITAALKKNAGIAMGNILGSNIFDFLGILGIAGTFKSLEFSKILIPDIFVTAGAAFLLFAAMFVGKKYTLKRWQGLIFITLYIIYFMLILQRG